MNKKTAVWTLIAVFLVVAGLVMIAAVMMEYKFDFTKLSTVEYETNTYEIMEEFNGISLETDTEDIVFALSGDGKCKVECYEEANVKHSVTVQEGNLKVGVSDERTLRDYVGFIGIRGGSPEVTVYLPKREYASLSVDGTTGDIEIPKEFKFENVDISVSTGDVDFCASSSDSVKIRASTGDICVKDVSVGSLDLSVTTGKITAERVDCEDLSVSTSTGKTDLTDISCRRLTSDGNTGEIALRRVIAEETFSIVRGTGDVKFDGCDAAEIFVETRTGKIAGSLLTEKVFLAQSNSGRVDVPKTLNGGKCEVKTATGNIELEIR